MKNHYDFSTAVRNTQPVKLLVLEAVYKISESQNVYTFVGVFSSEEKLEQGKQQFLTSEAETEGLPDGFLTYLTTVDKPRL